MSRKPKARPDEPKSADMTLILRPRDGETDQEAQARTLLEPFMRHGLVAGTFASRALGPTQDKPSLMDNANRVEAMARAAASGDLSSTSHMLSSQAMTLDAMFTELARCVALNMNEYPQAAEKYARLAMKAQSNSRATLEALAKLHQPREQTVRHLHVNDGGQAIVAEQFHHHAGGKQNDVSAEQSHATGTAETVGGSAALLGQDAGGNPVPVSSGQGSETVPHARRDKSGRTKR